MDAEGEEEDNEEEAKNVASKYFLYLVFFSFLFFFFCGMQKLMLAESCLGQTGECWMELRRSPLCDMPHGFKLNIHMV